MLPRLSSTLPVSCRQHNPACSGFRKSSYLLFTLFPFLAIIPTPNAIYISPGSKRIRGNFFRGSLFPCVNRLSFLRERAGRNHLRLRHIQEKARRPVCQNTVPVGSRSRVCQVYRRCFTALFFLSLWPGFLCRLESAEQRREPPPGH